MREALIILVGISVFFLVVGIIFAFIRFSIGLALRIISVVIVVMILASVLTHYLPVTAYLPLKTTFIILEYGNASHQNGTSSMSPNTSSSIAPSPIASLSTSTISAVLLQTDAFTAFYAPSDFSQFLTVPHQDIDVSSDAGRDSILTAQQLAQLLSSTQADTVILLHTSCKMPGVAIDGDTTTDLTTFNDCIKSSSDGFWQRMSLISDGSLLVIKSDLWSWILTTSWQEPIPIPALIGNESVLPREVIRDA